MNKTISILLLTASIGIISAAHADIVKCEMETGVIYTDTACNMPSSGKVLVSNLENNSFKRTVDLAHAGMTGGSDTSPRQTAWAVNITPPSRQLHVDVASIKAARAKLQSQDTVSVASR